MGFDIGGILGGIGSLLGGAGGIAGVMGQNKGTKKEMQRAQKYAIDQMQMAHGWEVAARGKTRAQNVADSLLARTRQLQDWKRQRAVDKRAIQDRVLDAKKAGIHPLAALGMNYSGGGSGGIVGTSSVQPMSIGPVGVSGGSYAGDAIGDGLGAVGDAFSQIGNLYESDQDDLERREQENYNRDLDERARLDKVVADTIEGQQRDISNRVSEAEIKRLDSETMLNAARARSELMQARAAAIGGNALPSQINLPYSGRWTLKPGTSSAQDAQNLLGEPGEWVGSVEQILWNLLNDPFGSMRSAGFNPPDERAKLGPRRPGQ